MDWNYVRPGLLPWGVSLRFAGEVALVAALSLSLVYAGSLRHRLAAERAQHSEQMTKVSAAAVAQAARVGQKEAEARELSAQIEQKGREHEEALRAAFADARRRVRDAARQGSAGQVPATARSASDPDGASPDAGVFTGLRAGGADEACAALTERYLLWQDFYDGVRRRVAEVGHE